MSGRLHIRGGTVIPVETSVPDLPLGDLVVEDGRIAYVGPPVAIDDAQVIEAADFIVLPGFVDAHRHTWQSAVRHRMGDADLLRYRREILGGVGPRYRPEDVHIGNLLGAAGALEAGTTTLLDWSQVQNTPAHSDAAVAALRESGIRAVFAHGWPRTEGAAWAVDSVRPHPDDIRRVRRDVLACDDALVTLALAGRGPEMTTMEVARQDLATARDLGIRTTMHVGIRGLGAKHRAVERMHAEGLLGPDLTFIHLCDCSDAELSMMADSGVSACIGPNCTMITDGIGVMPIGRLLSTGIRPCLSGDTETCGCGDMFTQMRFALGSARYLRNNRLEAQESPPVTIRDVLEFATIEGARACGLEARTGSLRPGKDADIVMIRKTDLNLAPVSDPVGAVVLGAHAGNVDTVLVRGRAVKKAGRLTGLDPGRIARQAAESQEFLLAA